MVTMTRDRISRRPTASWLIAGGIYIAIESNYGEGQTKLISFVV